MKPCPASLLCLLLCAACAQKPEAPKRRAAAASLGSTAADAEQAAEPVAEQSGDDPSFLAGTWEKVSDPDGEPKDWLLFNLPAQFTRLGLVKNSRQVQMLERGGFLFTGKWVETNFDGPGGQKINGSLEVSRDHKQLFLESPATGHRKIYQRGNPP